MENKTVNKKSVKTAIAKKIEGEEIKRINLIWQSAENLPTVYANQVLVSHSGPEFYLVFGEVTTPAILGDISNNLPDNLSVKPVIKIAITPEMIFQMADIIKTNVDRFLRRANDYMEKK